MINTVMVVEDNTSFRSGIIKLFRRSGLTVWAFPNAEEAARALTGCCPDVAILDVSLPGMKGTEFGRMVEQRSPNTRIIYVTAAPESIVRGTKEKEILAKPIEPEALMARMKR